MARALPVAAAAFLLAACSCSASDGVDAGSDLGLDAGLDASRDSGGDAAADAGPDAIVDASPGDADVDAPPDPAGWVAYTSWPDAGCTVEIASHPEAVFTPDWLPCPSAFPLGCMMLPLMDEPRESFGPGAQRLEAGSARFVIEQTGPTGGVREPTISILARSDGPPVAALREPPFVSSRSCLVGMVAAGGAHATVGVLGGTGAVVDERIWIADETRIATAPVADAERVANGLQHYALSPTTFAANIAGTGEVLVLEDGARTVITSSSPQSVYVVGRDVLWENWGADERTVEIAHGRIDGTNARLYFPPDGSYLRAFGTDGTDMAWVQCYGGDPVTMLWDHVELWTATFSADPTMVSPRMVAIVPSYPTRPAVGGGYYSWFDGYAGTARRCIYVSSLADGMLRQWWLPNGWQTNQVPLWIGGGEVAVSAREYDVTPPRVTLMRIPIASITVGTTATPPP